MSNTTRTKPSEGVSNHTSELEYVKQLETQISNNLTEIDDLHRFIDNVCDTDESLYEPNERIGILMDENEELNEEITEFYDKYLIEEVV
jgi:hypothetical protein